VSAELAAAEDRLASLEAEAHLVRMRVRTAADAGDLDETIRLYHRIASLRRELLAARHVVVRLTRREHRHRGEATALNTAEHLLDIELARLGVEPDPALKRIFG
jgi:hypothetical protein